MKKALKKKSVKIQILIYNTLIFGFLIVNIVVVRGFEIPFDFATDYLLMAIGFICLLICWVIGNHHINKYRRKNQKWIGKIPDEIKDKVWEIRTPWLITFAGVIIAIIVYYAAMG